MSFSVGIVGLPNVGKSTLFKALTKKQVDIASYPFTTINPNVGTVAIPDKRLKKIADLIKPEKVTYTIIEFVDIAGLIKGAHKGEGLGNQFLSHIRNCDLILEVVRVFKGEGIEHVTGEINPQQDIEIVESELLMKDLEMTENLLQKLERDIKAGDKNILKRGQLLQKIHQNLSRGKLISTLLLSEEEKEEIREYQFLTLKSIIYVLNVGERQKEVHQENLKKLSPNLLIINLKLEEEISELSPEEREELGIKSQLDPGEEFRHDFLKENQISRSESKFLSGVDQLILACYNTLDLITFYTVAGGKETRAWTLKRGETVLGAAGCVHSDFQEKFIRAEVVSWQDLIKAGSCPEGRGSFASLRGRNGPGAAWPKAREKGQIKTVGKDYIVQDGDVIEFKI